MTQHGKKLRYELKTPVPCPVQPVTGGDSAFFDPIDFCLAKLAALHSTTKAQSDSIRDRRIGLIRAKPATCEHKVTASANVCFHSEERESPKTFANKRR